MNPQCLSSHLVKFVPVELSGAALVLHGSVRCGNVVLAEESHLEEPFKDITYKVLAFIVILTKTISN